MSFDLAPVAQETTYGTQIWARGGLATRHRPFGRPTPIGTGYYLWPACAYCGSWNVVVVLETVPTSNPGYERGALDLGCPRSYRTPECDLESISAFEACLLVHVSRTTMKFIVPHQQHEIL
jgi:hypothetical protein